MLEDPEHRQARAGMLNAALMGGVAFQKGLGVTHSLAHALSTVCDLHHGLVNGICLPYAMSFNTDVGDSWEREGEDREFFREFSPDGYALGVDVLLYAMTH